MTALSKKVKSEIWDNDVTFEAGAGVCGITVHGEIVGGVLQET